MSYCRWSSDDFQCDLYCYEDVMGGWTTHIASKRRIRKPNTISPYSLEAIEVLKKDKEEYTRLSKKYHNELDRIKMKPIGLPHDGESFNDSTLVEFRGRIKYLLSLGYKGRPNLIEDIEEEIKEGIE